MGVANISGNILTDSGTSLTGLVPYTGATQSVNLGTWALTSGGINSGAVISTNRIQGLDFLISTGGGSGTLVSGYSKLAAKVTALENKA